MPGGSQSHGKLSCTARRVDRNQLSRNLIGIQEMSLAKLCLKVETLERINAYLIRLGLVVTRRVTNTSL